MRGVRTLLCMLIGLTIGSVAGVVIVNVTHDRGKKNAATTAITTEDATVLDATVSDASAGNAEKTQEEQELSKPGDPTVSDEEQPQELVQALSESLVSFSQLAEVGCRQLILVDSAQETARISMYTCDDDGRWRDAELDTNGYVGANGVSRDSYEGSHMTPAGVYPIREAFYIEEEPDTGLDTFQITEYTYWVDDSDSSLYNQRVELGADEDKTWNSAEHMVDYPDSYRYGFVIGFNESPAEPGRGSAIFFHVGNHSTLGCVAAPEDMVLAYLEELSADCNPYIVIK